MSQNHVDLIESSLSGDSVDKFEYTDNENKNSFRSITFDQAAATYTNATRTLDALAGQALTELSVSDAISVNGDVSEVKTITNNIFVVFKQALGGDLAAENIATIKYLNKIP